MSSRVRMHFVLYAKHRLPLLFHLIPPLRLQYLMMTSPKQWPLSTDEESTFLSRMHSVVDFRNGGLVKTAVSLFYIIFGFQAKIVPVVNLRINHISVAVFLTLIRSLVALLLENFDLTMTFTNVRF